MASPWIALALFASSHAGSNYQVLWQRVRFAIFGVDMELEAAPPHAGVAVVALSQ
jgi:hypothetical protein